MYKICLVVNGLSFGGVEQVLYNYLKNYDRAQFKFDIIAQREISIQSDIDRFKNLGFNIQLVTHKRKNPIKNYFQIKKIIKYGSYDVVHSNMSNMNFYVLKLAKKYGVKVRVNHYHNIFNCGKIKQVLIKKCNKLCDKYATHNIFCSNAVAEYFGKANKNAFILTNAIELDKFKFNIHIRNLIRKQNSIEDDEYVVGNIGRFAEQKNQLFLIDIFTEYHKINPKSKLLLCGEGEMIELIKRKCLALGILNSVIFAGVSSSVEEYYNAMDCFVFPSKFEGLGMTFLEAQINGLNCVVSDVVPKEAIISDTSIVLSIYNDSPLVWAGKITLDNCNSHNCKFDERVGKYDINICGQTLIDFYTTTILGI